MWKYAQNPQLCNNPLANGLKCTTTNMFCPWLQMQQPKYVLGQIRVFARNTRIWRTLYLAQIRIFEISNTANTWFLLCENKGQTWLFAVRRVQARAKRAALTYLPKIANYGSHPHSHATIPQNSAIYGQNAECQYLVIVAARLANMKTYLAAIDPNGTVRCRMRPYSNVCGLYPNLCGRIWAR